MPAFSVDGIMSGLNTTEILSKLMEVERQPVKRLQTRQAEATNRLTAFRDANARLLALKTQADVLKGSDTMRANKAVSSDDTIVQATANSQATPGSYLVKITQRAQYHKVSGTSIADESAALGLSGEVLINGKEVEVTTDDTLISFIAKINQAGSGVTATLLTVSPTDKRIVLTAASSGVDARLDLAEASGDSVLQSLGVLESDTATKHSLLTGSAASGPFTIDGTNDKLKLTLSGTTKTVTLSHQSAVSSSSMAAAMATDINNAFATDGLKVKVEYDASVSAFRFLHDGSTLSVLDAGAGDARSTLGLLTTTSKVGSTQLADQTTAVGNLLGLNSAPSGTVQINGTNVALDLAADSLSGVKTKIDSAAPPGVTTTIVTITDSDGTTHQQLQLEGVSSMTDANHVLATLGLVQKSAAHQLTAAQDALLSVDNTTVTKASNSVSDLVPGVTFSLLSAPAALPEVAVEVTRDTERVLAAVRSFVEQFNSFMSFVADQFDFDPETKEGGVLLGNSTLAQVQGDVVAGVTNPVEALSGDYTVLADIGITLESDGTLTVDEAALSQALASDPEGVARLFVQQATTTHPNVSFVSASDVTKPSSEAGYLVNITQAATKGAATASVAQTSPSSTAETLTFSGSLFANAPTTFVLSQGNSLTDTINQINWSATLSGKVTASQTGGKLVLTSKVYGASGSFTVVSDLAAGSDNSGIGTTPLSASGADVAGTINGEAAEGAGQLLTGESGNANTDGLSLLITAASTGDLGTVILSRGVGDRLSTTLKLLTDTTSGAVPLAEDAIQEEIDGLKDSISSMEERATIRQERLQRQFAEMERLLGQYKTQSAMLTNQLALIQQNTRYYTGSAESS